MRPFEGAPFEKAAKRGLDGIDQSEHRGRILFEGRKGTGRSSYSVNIDAAMRVEYATAPRWDYGIWYGSDSPKVAFVEAHKAESGEVALVLRKKQWLKDILIGTRLPPTQWFWLATGRNKIPRQSSEMRRLYIAKIRLESKELVLN